MFDTRIAAFIELFLAAITWSSFFLIIKVLEETGLDPVVIISARMILAAILIGIVAIAMRLKMPRLKDVPLLMIPGILFFFGSILIGSGEEGESPGVTAFIGFLIPIIISLFLLEKLKVKLTHIGIAALVVAVFGFLLTGLGDDFIFSFDLLVVFFGACLVGVYFVSQKFLVKKHGPYVVTCFTMWGSAIFGLYSMPEFFGNLSVMSTNDWLMLSLIAIVSTLIPFFLFTHAMRIVGPAEGTAVNILIPFFGSLLSFLFSGFPITTLTIIGGVVSLVGVLFYITRGIESTE